MNEHHMKRLLQQFLRHPLSKKPAVWVGIVVLVVIGFVITTVFQPKNERSQATISTGAVKYVRSTDGDTAVMSINGKDEKVRFLLIDTPETVKENTPVQPFGKEASERTKALLTRAKTVTLEHEPGETKDEYDRVLAYVFVDGKMLQETLVEEGLARVAFFEKDEKYYHQLVKAQEKAKSQKIGIWSKEGYVTNRGFNG